MEPILDLIQDHTGLSYKEIYILFVFFVFLFIILTFLFRKRRKLRNYNKLLKKFQNFTLEIYSYDPCMKCFENEVKIVDLSKNGRSIKYKCSNCGKQSFAPANSECYPEAVKLWDQILSLNGYLFEKKLVESDSPSITFTLNQTAPLPSEKSSRERIPENIRSEVWRRDGGKCASCESTNNLQFDHVIPVSKGGASSAVNLQILCRDCNLKKGDKI